VTYRVDFTGGAAKQLRSLDSPIRRKLLVAIAQLGEDPRPPGVQTLGALDNAWRIRKGSYRIIYEIHDDHHLVIVFRAAHRREVYRQG